MSNNVYEMVNEFNKKNKIGLQIREFKTGWLIEPKWNNKYVDNLKDVKPEDITLEYIPNKNKHKAPKVREDSQIVKVMKKFIQDIDGTSLEKQEVHNLIADTKYIPDLRLSKMLQNENLTNVLIYLYKNRGRYVKIDTVAKKNSAIKGQNFHEFIETLKENDIVEDKDGKLKLKEDSYEYVKFIKDSKSKKK